MASLFLASAHPACPGKIAAEQLLFRYELNVFTENLQYFSMSI